MNRSIEEEALLAALAQDYPKMHVEVEKLNRREVAAFVNALAATHDYAIRHLLRIHEPPDIAAMHLDLTEEEQEAFMKEIQEMQ